MQLHAVHVVRFIPRFLTIRATVYHTQRSMQTDTIFMCMSSFLLNLLFLFFLSFLEEVFKMRSSKSYVIFRGLITSRDKM